MKYILSLIISVALVVSGFGQTRNVLVGTNNTVVQPTNFWSADASNARTGLGLGTAATNPSSAFQPSSSILSNLASGNGGALSNIQATNLVGIIPSSNISTVTLTNISGTLSIVSGGTGATNAANARQNLGLGTASTSSLTDFQPADSDLTNLAVNNAINLTNFPTLLLRTNGNGAELTNITAANITGIVALASNLSSPLSLTNGGTGATNASTARTNLNLGWPALTNSNAATTLLGYTTNGQVVYNGTNTLRFSNSVVLGTDSLRLTITDTELAVYSGAQGLNVITIPTDDPAQFSGNYWNEPTIRASFGFSTNLEGLWTATNFAIARTNLGLGATWLTNTNVTNFRTAIGLGWSALTNSNAATTLLGYSANGQIVYTNTNTLTFTNSVNFINGDMTIAGVGIQAYGVTFNFEERKIQDSDTNIGDIISWTSGETLNFSLPINFGTNAATTRTNLGLGWSALTNTNAGTSLVSVNTNGDVVSPTNFWQAAPIFKRFVETQPVANQTTNIQAARDIQVYSLSISTVGITNTIALPTSGSLSGDTALIVHRGPTSSVTAVRTAGAGTNLVTLNQFDEAVEFVYYNNAWQLNQNKSFVGPIYFSGTNATANAAASRTNLGVGATWLTNTNVTNFRTAIGLGTGNDVAFNNVSANNDVFVANLAGNGDTAPIAVDDNGALVYVGSSATYRSRIGLPLQALTNTSNVTAMRALGGSTNTNEPYSGSVSLTNTNTLVFSNGVLLRIQ